MRLLHEIAIFQTVKSKVIFSLFETVRLSVSISLRNLYWLATSRGRFYYITIACNQNIVSRDSMILINKLGVTVGILLITFWNRL